MAKRAFYAYLRPMSFKKDISPSGALADFCNVWRSNGEKRWLILLASCLPAAILIYGIYEDVRKKSVPPPPGIIYVESWPADRSAEQIMADRAERAKLMEAQIAEQKRRYEALGRASGMDVDAIKADIEAKRRAKDTSRAEAADKPAEN